MKKQFSYADVVTLALSPSNLDMNKKEIREIFAFLIRKPVEELPEGHISSAVVNYCRQEILSEHPELTQVSKEIHKDHEEWSRGHQGNLFLSPMINIPDWLYEKLHSKELTA